MKKLVLIAALAVAAVAFAGDVIQASFVQTGNGANGMTSAAPALTTDGMAVQSSAFSITTRCPATQALVSAQAQVGKFNNTAFQAYERGWLFLPSPDAGASTGSFSWQEAPFLDLAIDAGNALAANGGTTQTWAVPLPTLPNGARVAWTGEQVSQATTNDAGVNLGIVLFAPSSCN